MSIFNKFKYLCPPAMVYFVISIVALVVVFIQNIGSYNRFHMGSFSCRVPSTLLVFLCEFIYILFWTWILNLICKDGHTAISWLLVLFPFILSFVIIGLLILNM